MSSVLPPRDWTDIHWPDISGAGVARWIAVLPLAATEQHGPHLPLGTDVMIAEAYLKRARELLPENIPASLRPVQPAVVFTDDYHFPAAGRDPASGVHVLSATTVGGARLAV